MSTQPENCEVSLSSSNTHNSVEITESNVAKDENANEKNTYTTGLAAVRKKVLNFFQQNCGNLDYGNWLREKTSSILKSKTEPNNTKKAFKHDEEPEGPITYAPNAQAKVYPLSFKTPIFSTTDTKKTIDVTKEHFNDANKIGLKRRPDEEPPSEGKKRFKFTAPVLNLTFDEHNITYMESNCMAGDPSTLISHNEPNWKLRNVLVDWITEVHYFLGFSPETLFVTVDNIDQILCFLPFAIYQMKLIGIVALFIAAKLEEKESPSISNFLYMIDNVITDEELREKESWVLSHPLYLHSSRPNPAKFLRHICIKELGCDVKTRNLASYFIEISCIDQELYNYIPSVISAASLLLSKKMLSSSEWDSNFSRLSGYTSADLEPTVQRLLSFLSQPTSSHGYFYKKWSSPDFYSASIFARDWVKHHYTHE